MSDKAIGKHPAHELAGFQRKYLRGLVHGAKAVVQVGQQGITDGVINSVKEQLLAHELIKVRMHEPEDKKGMAQELADRAGAHLCGLIGHNAVLYRQRPKKPTISLPKK